MSDTEGIASSGTPRNGVADAGASPAGSGSVAEGPTAGAGSPGSGADGPGSGAAIPGSAANPLSATTGSTPQIGVGRRETLRADNGTPVTVTIVPMPTGKKAKKSWVWQVFREFTPSVSGKNIFCAAKVVKRGILTTCKHMLSWKPGAGTSGMVSHFATHHKKAHQELMKDHTTEEVGKAGVSAAIGEGECGFALLYLSYIIILF